MPGSEPTGEVKTEESGALSCPDSETVIVTGVVPPITTPVITMSPPDTVQETVPLSPLRPSVRSECGAGSRRPDTCHCRHLCCSFRSARSRARFPRQCHFQRRGLATYWRTFRLGVVHSARNRQTPVPRQPDQPHSRLLLRSQSELLVCQSAPLVLPRAPVVSVHVMANFGRVPLREATLGLLEAARPIRGAVPGRPVVAG